MPTSSLSRAELVRWWTNPNVYGTCLLALLLDQHGTEALDFEPETIRLEARDALGIDIPQVNMDKLMGLIAALTTELFYVSVETFHHVCTALSHNEADFHQMEPLEAEEAAWGVTEVTLNDAADNEQLREYSHEVRLYVGVLLQREGILTPPPVLKMAEFPQEQNPVEQTFADDPSLIQAFAQKRHRESEHITLAVQSEMAALVGQLEKLPLESRDPDSWASFAAKARQRLQLPTPSAED